MALLLRSTIIRHFSHVSRCVSFARCASVRPPLNVPVCVVNDFTRNIFAEAQESRLDRSLRRLDQDARRSGRISKRELEDVLGELQHSRSATSTQSLLLIRCCGSLVPEELPETRTRLVQDIWKTLENLGVAVDISHYNALLRVYLENEYKFSPTEFLADLEKKGIEPNRVTYQRLIARYCQEGDIEGATHILEFMRAKQLPVNENVFNALILGHSQADDMVSAAGILGVMKQAGLEPSAETYTTLLCGYGKSGDIAAVRDILRQCEQNDVQLSDRDYMDIIYALAINGHQQHVDEIMNRLSQSPGYNHDAINLILRLINKHQLQVAKKVLHTMSPATKNGEPMPTGNFFIRQLVRANYPVEETIAVCEELENGGHNSRALLVATETSLMLGNIKYSYALFSALKARGHNIRQHYFWPLITACGKANSIEGILDVLQTMQFKYQIQVGGEILREYAVPHLWRLSREENKAQAVVRQLNSVGISRGAAAMSLVYHLLNENDLAGAAAVVKHFRAQYSPVLLRKPLLQAYRQTMDGVSFAIVLRQMYDSVEQMIEQNSKNISSDDDDNAPIFDNLEMVGFCVLDAVGSIKKKSPEIVIQLLEGLEHQGLGFSNSIAERLVEKLGMESVNDHISELLEHLTSGDIRPTMPSRRVNYGVQRESHFKGIADKGGKEEQALAKRQLLSLYCRNKEIEKVDALRKEIENEDVALNAGNVAQMIDLYVFAGQLNTALDLYEKYRTKMNFTLDKIKIVKLAKLMVENNCLEEALELLKNDAISGDSGEQSYTFNNICRSLLFHLANNGQVDELKKVFDTLVEYNYMDINNIMLGPLVKVHLVRNDIDAALKQFEELCNKYQCTPWKNELSIKLIEAEDATSLQKLTDLSTKVHGEVNSLYDLVFAFLECGRVRQARKILETPGLRLRSERVNFACKRFQSEGKVSSLEGFMEATKELSYIDRSDICQHLLVSYCHSKDTEKALNLWTRMQEENIQPTDEFLYTLGNYLKDSGLSVPFAIPDIPDGMASDENSEVRKIMPSSPESQRFASLLQRQEFLDALVIHGKLNNEEKLNIPRVQYSSLLEGVVKVGSLEQTRHLLIDLLKNKQFPLPPVFRFAVNRLSMSGDTHTLLTIEKYLNNEQRKIIRYDNKLCNSYLFSGQASVYVDNLEKEVDQLEDVEVLSEKFPSGGILQILRNCPELFERVEKLAYKHEARGSFTPLNVLWVYFMILHQYEKADKIFNEYLSSQPRLLLRQIFREAEQKNDEELLEHLISNLRKSSIPESTIGVAYRNLINVQLSNGKFKEAVDTYHEGKNVMDNMDDATMQKLEDAAKRCGVALNSPGLS